MSELTPREVIAQAIEDGGLYSGDCADEVLAALRAAGYEIEQRGDVELAAKIIDAVSDFREATVVLAAEADRRRRRRVGR